MQKLRLLDNKNNIIVSDYNWFGGVWGLQDFLTAEDRLDRVVVDITSKNLSPFEAFVCAYRYAANRPYRFAPKGSPFQACRSYVDVLTKGFCVCVGYATVLKRLCDKLGIECAVQGCYAKDKFGKSINHANCIVYIKDEKYKCDGLYYCDPRMDCPGLLDFEKYNKGWNLNLLALPITDIGKIQLKIWNDDTIIEMNDFQSIYYTRNPNAFDLEYFSKFFSMRDSKTIMTRKYCAPIKLQTILDALKNIGLSNEEVEQTQHKFIERKPYFIQETQINNANKEWEIRLGFERYIESFLKHKGRATDLKTLDCATLIYRLYKDYLDIDVLQNGKGKSWTGKIMTSDRGTTQLIDEQALLDDKIRFIDTKCKVGDVLLFHRQSKVATKTTDDNYFPGHCGIYLGNHKYVDSRLTSRGNVSIVDIESDDYMQFFIGAKDFISCRRERVLDNSNLEYITKE